MNDCDRNVEGADRVIGPAPADARPHAPWPIWRRAVAYLVLAGIALLCIWYVDRRAHVSVEQMNRQTDK